MTTEIPFVPETVEEAHAILASVGVAELSTLSRERFLAVWNSVAYLHPGLHPDHFDEPDGGWSGELMPFAVEAWRRAANGVISSDEVYPSDAQWCGLCDQIAAPTLEESTRRMEFVTRPMIRVGDIVRFVSDA